MNLSITTTSDTELTKNMVSLVKEKIQGQIDPLIYFLDDDLKKAELNIEERSRWGYRVNFSMRVPKKKQIFAEKTEAEFEAAIRTLAAEIKRQVKDYRAEIGRDEKINRLGLRGATKQKVQEKRAEQTTNSD